jgi:hypothetical protein
MPPLSVKDSPIPVSLSAPDAFRQDPASLNGEREQDSSMNSLVVNLLVLLPGLLSVTFMMWFLVMFCKASGKR